MKPALFLLMLQYFLGESSSILTVLGWEGYAVLKLNISNSGVNRGKIYPPPVQGEK